MQKVVVFGAASYLGRLVGTELLRKGFHVCLYASRPMHGALDASETVIGSLLNKIDVEKACANADFVYNFEDWDTENYLETRPLFGIESQMVGNLNVLEGCRVVGVKRFLYASSQHRPEESDSFERIKRQTNERYTELYFQRYGLPYTILRFASLHGKGLDEGAEIHRLFEEAAQFKQMSANGSVEEWSEYLHIADAASASVQALGEEYKNQYVSVRGSEKCQRQDVMNLIRKVVGQEVGFRASENAAKEAGPASHAYKPRVGKKLVVNPFVDMGQGILECVHEISQELGYERRMQFE